MSTQEIAHLVQQLGDHGIGLREHVATARRLADCVDPVIISHLVQMAEDDGVDPLLSREVGASIAEIVIRKGSLDQVPLHDFTESAYLGYDEVVARHLGAPSR